MTQDAFEHGKWQAVIDAHRQESHDAAEWLRDGSALLHSIEPGPKAGKQQQHAALAFVQARRVGASARAVAAAQRKAVLANLRQALELVGIPGPAAPAAPASLRRVLLVIGMHRSGTSALAGLLCHQESHWANLVERSKPGLSGNPRWDAGTGAGRDHPAQQRHPMSITRLWSPDDLPRGSVTPCRPLDKCGTMVGTYQVCNSPRWISTSLIKPLTW